MGSVWEHRAWALLWWHTQAVVLRREMKHGTRSCFKQTRTVYVGPNANQTMCPQRGVLQQGLLPHQAAPAMEDVLSGAPILIM